MLLVFSLIYLSLLLLFTLYKVIFKSPTVFYKVQSINAFTSLTVLLLMVYVYFIKKPEFVDLALVYVVINYIGIVAVLKFITFSYNKSNPSKTKNTS